MFVNTTEEANYTLKKVLVNKGKGIEIDGQACCVPTRLYCRIWANIVEETLLNSAA